MSVKLPFWATILTALGLCVLCALGSWQLQRLAWKTDILQKLEAAYNSETSALLDFAATDRDFIYGRVEGAFMPDKALLIGPRTRNKEIGNDLIVPLKVGQRTVLVNMGWTAWTLEEQPIYHLQGRRVWFEGLARKPDWNAFTPNNVPDQNLWYKPDIAEIAQARDLASPYPYMLYVVHASHKFDAAFPNNERFTPNNNHLQYAIFWFAMAGGLLVVYVLRFVIS